MKRPFASLNPQEALRVAIFIEQRNADIYRRLGEMFVEFGDPESTEMSGVFWEMAVEERNHAALLQRKYADSYGDASCSLTEEDLLEFIEVPDLRAGDVFPAGELEKGEAQRRALQVALDAEMSAQQFYKTLADNTSEGPLRQLYRELAQMEDTHVGHIRRRLAAKVPAAILQ